MEPRPRPEPFQNQDSSPFRDELKPARPYEHMTINHIMELQARPDKIVRVSLRNNKGAEDTHQWVEFLAEQLIESDRLFKELTKSYDIQVVPHQHVIAGSPDDPRRVTAYTVADRVLGDSFRSELEKSPPGVTQAEVEHLYHSLIAYHANILEHGGTYLSDVTRNNAQYMYGHTAEDPAQRIYLVDIDAMYRKYPVHDPTAAESRDLHRNIATLAGCITKAEEVTGWDFSSTKVEYLERLDVVPLESEFRNYVDSLKESMEK